MDKKSLELLKIKCRENSIYVVNLRHIINFIKKNKSPIDLVALLILTFARIRITSH